jgi:hypothetical protein
MIRLIVIYSLLHLWVVAMQVQGRSVSKPTGQMGEAHRSLRSSAILIPERAGHQGDRQYLSNRVKVPGPTRPGP